MALSLRGIFVSFYFVFQVHFGVRQNGFNVFVFVEVLGRLPRFIFFKRSRFYLFTGQGVLGPDILLVVRCGWVVWIAYLDLSIVLFVSVLIQSRVLLVYNQLGISVEVFLVKDHTRIVFLGIVSLGSLQVSLLLFIHLVDFYPRRLIRVRPELSSLCEAGRGIAFLYQSDIGATT